LDAFERDWFYFLVTNHQDQTFTIDTSTCCIRSNANLERRGYRPKETIHKKVWYHLL